MSISWKSKEYNHKYGKIIFMSNCVDGWEIGKKQGEEYEDIMIMTEGFHGKVSVSLTPEQVEDLRDAFTEYLEYMDGDNNDSTLDG